MEREFIPPGPGTWVLETTHFGAAGPRYTEPLFAEGISKGFVEGMVNYGMPADDIRMRAVNGFTYVRQMMLGEPEDPPANPPPGWLLWLMTRLHPAFRQRNKNALQAVKEKRWEKDLAEWDEWKPDSIARNLKLAEVDLAALSDEELITHLVACSENLLEMYYRHHKWSVPAIYPVGRYLSAATASGHISAGEAIALLKGSTPVSTGAFAEELSALNHALSHAGATIESLTAVPAADFVEHVRGLGEQASAALNNYLKHVGQMLVSGYSTTEKTVQETPAIIKTRVLNAMKPATDNSSEEAATQALIAAARAKLPENERDTFDATLKEARYINRLRDERGIYNDIWGAGVMRTAILEANRRLVERGTLPQGQLAIEADHYELVGLLRGEAAVDTAELQARWDWRTNTKIEDAPPFLGPAPDTNPPPFHLFPAGLRGTLLAMLTAFGNLNDDEEAEPAADAATLKGLPVSPGVYEGTARVISGPEDFERLVPGDVLITKNTSAAFNVVLPILGALVTDRGGLLSHAAIVSREYGIPGVVATKTATRTIADGSKVRVDGTAGTVSLI